MLEATLQQWSHTVRSAADGTDGLAAAREFKPEIVVSDIVMPGMDGYQLCSRLKADPDLKGVPVILLTALSDSRDVMGALQCGADGFVKHRALTIAATVGVWVLAWLWAPHVSGGPVICPLHGLLGLPCVGCGLTRAMCELTRFHFLAALQLNALSIPVALLFLAAPAVGAVELALGRRLHFYRFLFSMRVAYVTAFVVAGYHLVRCGAMVWTGTLFPEYVQTSWTYQLISRWTQ
jgi:CheY-like chemotaxis protein